VLLAKCRLAIERTGLTRLVVAGGVGANRPLRRALAAAGARDGFDVYFPEQELCTDNGAMIAFAAAMRLRAGLASEREGLAFTVKPRWPLPPVPD
jgi:N6-L-threonylcarbamoyladenine synthase